MAVSPHKQKNWRVPHTDIKHGEIKLDIGCGVKMMKKDKNFLGLDIEDHGQEYLWDVDNGIPLADSSCKEIFMHHTLEHFKDPITVLNECWRVLRAEGKVEIIVPYYKEPEAYVLHHTHFFSRDTFRHLEIPSLRERYGIQPWNVVFLEVGEKEWISDFGQPTVHAILEPYKRKQ